MDRILLIEDEALERRVMARLLTQHGYEILTAADWLSASGLLTQIPDVIVTDLFLKGPDGLEVLREAQRLQPETPVIIITGHGTIASAVHALKQGAFDYLTKPVDPEELLLAIKRAVERSELYRELRRLRQEVKERGGLLGIIGGSRCMQQVFERIQQVAPTHSTILITGESGTGKELVARAIHELSPRNQGPFIALNCAAIPKDLAESELFGHARGAFTGATAQRIGKFGAANSGTLLIDEIGEMELPIQAKFVRALETHAFSPVGDNEEQSVNVRVVAATHRNLRGMVGDGKFREDLYFRLHVVEIQLPPLRQRREDIPALVAAFLERINKEQGRDVREITVDAMDRLTDYHWPGNVRELRNLLEGLVILSRSDVIGISDLPAELQNGSAAGPAQRFPHGYTLAKIERDAIQQRLLETDGSRQQAAALLGISTRTLLRKIRKYRLDDPLRGTPADSTKNSLPHGRMNRSASQDRFEAGQAGRG